MWLPTAQCFRPSSLSHQPVFCSVSWPIFLATPLRRCKRTAFFRLCQSVCVHWSLDLFLGITASLFPCKSLRLPQLQFPCTRHGSVRLLHHHPSLPIVCLAAQCAERRTLPVMPLSASLGHNLPHSAALSRTRPHSAAIGRFLPHLVTICRTLPHSAALCRIRPLSAALCRFLLHRAALRRFPPYPPLSAALCRALSVAASLSPCAPSIVSQCCCPSLPSASVYI